VLTALSVVGAANRAVILLPIDAVLAFILTDDDLCHDVVFV
jgi:hypothetical protein